MNTSQFASRYVAGYNLAIIPLPPRSKAPAEPDWPSKYFRDAYSAQRYFTLRPDHNIGCVLGPSKLCSIDIDDSEAARTIFAEWGIDIDVMATQAATIEGKPGRMRMEFAAPPNVDLSRHNLTWPRKDDLTKRFTVFEFRAGDVQDVFPPSIHPDTGKPYVWLTLPRAGKFPPLPAAILPLWQYWDVFKAQAEALCPWAPKVERKANGAAAKTLAPSPDSPIHAFIAQADLGSTLERYGYQRVGHRYLSPHSTTGLAGVCLTDDSRCFIHHASDPLCTDESGHPINAFDLFCHYEHGGDINAAVRAAAKLLGMERMATRDARSTVTNGGTATAAEVPRTDAPVGPLKLDGAEILDDVHDYLGRFVAYPSPHCQIAHTLWLAHTHLMDVWDSTPRIAFLSPEPSSGKSRALEVSELLVPRAVEAVNVTPAYLFRKVAAEDGRPTILYDEIDTVFGPKAKDNEEIRGLLNAGHRKHSKAGRCAMRGKQVVTEEIEAYCAVALAGLGGLPDTILTRSVIVRMRRRAPAEVIEPYRRRTNGPAGEQLGQRLAAWARSIESNITGVFPEMPSGIVDRDADVWEPLLRVADAAGGVWSSVARVAAVALVGDSKQSTPSLGVQLLADLKRVFGDAELLSTESILTGLHGLDESPWNDLRGKQLDARGLSNRLRPYGIAPRNIRIGTATPKGYRREDLHDAWLRYLPIVPATSATSATSAASAISDVAFVAESADADAVSVQ